VGAIGHSDLSSLYAQVLYNNFSACRVTTPTRRANRSLLA